MWLETKTGDVQFICSAPSNLRHSASFSCLSKNGSQVEKPYRARTATLTPGDVDYGFAVRRTEAPDLSSNYNCDLIPERSELTEAKEAKNERPNLLREMLIKKSVGLLNPNVWWAPKFRGVKNGKSSDKSLSDVQSQKRWRSLGALLKVSNSNAPRTCNAQPSSLRAKSFYLLDDFLIPSENQQRNVLEQNALISTNNSCNSLELPSLKSPPVPPPPVQYHECRNECSPYRNCRDCSAFSSPIARCVGKDSIVKSSRGGKTLPQKGGHDRLYLELPALQLRTALVKCQYNLCATGVPGNNNRSTASVENHKSEPSIAQPLPADSHTAIKSSSFLRSSNSYSSSQNKLERSLIKTGSSFNGSDICSNYSTEQPMKRISNKPSAKKFPLTPTEALVQHGSFLTEYEKKEIVSYSEIWFLGLKAKKIRADENAGYNYGFDDENGNYNKVVNDHLCYRYQVLYVLGKGSFGQVVKAFDHKNGIFVAIKIIRNKKRFYHQAQVELVILNHLRRKDVNGSHNVIHMLDYFYFRRHLCITFELFGMNLYEVIKRNGYQGFCLPVVRKYAYSLVQCLRLLYREKIIHCDLKPENILLQKPNSHNIKVIDFGSSCYTYQKVYTYIQSRFYRSPEIILGLAYNNAIDMWSFGCILAELYTGYPLFPGENEVDQLACIMEVIGLPPYEVMARASRRKLFFDSKGSPRYTVNSKQRKRKPASKDLAEALRNDDALFIDFISRCLEWNPEKRLTADEALQHDWLKDFVTLNDNNSISDIRIEETDCFLSS